MCVCQTFTMLIITLKIKLQNSRTKFILLQFWDFKFNLDIKNLMLPAAVRLN